MEDVSRYKKLVYEIIGAALDVYNELNYGLLESIYQEALVVELQERGIQCKAEVEIPIFYKKKPLSKKFRLDILVDDIVIELKAVSEVTPEHRAQLCNYLRLTKKPIGLLINFGGYSLYGERWALDETNNECYKLNKELQPID